MTGKQKLYFLLDAIVDFEDITPSSKPIKIHATRDINNRIRGEELDMLFDKLENDEKIIRVLKKGNRIKEAASKYGFDYDDGCYHIKLLPTFTNYFQKIQWEPEYQAFTGKKPLATQIKFGINVFISDLEARYQDIVNEKAVNSFYLKLADYGKCFNENDIADPIFAELYTNSQKQISNLKEHWKEFFKTWKDYAKKLVKKADEVGIKDEGPLQDELKKLRVYLSDPNPQFSSDNLPNYWQPYREIILRFDKAGLKNEIFKEHIDKINGDLMLYPEYHKVEVAWDKYKQAREISVWWAHYQVSRLTAGVLSNDEEKGHYFKDDNHVDQMYKYEFDKISRGEAETLIFLRKNKFEEWIRRLHTYIIPRIKELPRVGQTSLEVEYQQLIEEIKGLANPKSDSLEERYKKLIVEFRANNINPDLMIGSASPSLSRKGLEKKWDVLQSIWTIYESNSRPDAVLVPVDALTVKDRTVEEIDGIIEGLKNVGCLKEWERRNEYYDLIGIDRHRLPDEYSQTESNYKAFARKYEKGKVQKKGSPVDNGKDLDKQFSFELCLKGDRLIIKGKIIKGENLCLTKVTRGSGILIDPILKVCRNKPGVFKLITESDISSKFSMGDSILAKAISNIPQFKKYLSGIGFKRELKSLFYANSPGGLGFKFRTAIPEDEWRDMSKSRKQKVVNIITKLSAQG